MLKVVWSYKGAPGMVSLQKNEYVTEVTPDDDGWTLVKKKDGSEGSVPSTHLGNNIFNCIVHKNFLR